MGGIEDLRQELSRLMRDHLDHLDSSVFTGRLTDEEYRPHAERLTRIREVSADYLAALRRLMHS